jgi:hypothetical protein
MHGLYPGVQLLLAVADDAVAKPETKIARVRCDESHLAYETSLHLLPPSSIRMRSVTLRNVETTRGVEVVPRLCYGGKVVAWADRVEVFGRGSGIDRRGSGSCSLQTRTR